MKRCPECRRDYYDDTLLYCLDDGNALLEGPASGKAEPPASAGGQIDGEPKTAILHTTAAPSEAPTWAQIHTTEQTAVLPRGSAAEPRDSLSALPKKPSLSANRAAKGLVALAVALLILVGGFFSYRYLSPAKQIESIAVMPFINEGKNEDVEYLSDGMTETLIKSLSDLPNLNVKPRSSVFRYKGKDTDLKTIGKELNVEAILNGRVIQRGEQLTLSLELIDVQNDKVLWTESYQRKQSDLVILQSEIAKDVSTKLISKLSGADEAKVTKISTTNPEAYQAYLKGRYYWNRRTTENIKKAIEQFKAATDRDPSYALAYAGLADCYIILPQYTGAPMSETLPQAKAFAERAIAIDEQLGEPHASLGKVFEHSWRWAESEHEYKRAIELNSHYATAFHWYSILLKTLGRFDESATMINRAAELDPLSSIIGTNVSEMLQTQNDHEASVQNSLKVIEIDPSFPLTHSFLGMSYIKLGRNAEGIATIEQAVELSKRSSYILSDLGYAYAVSGRRFDAISIIKELEANYAKRESSGLNIAEVYVGLGDKDKAFEWLAKDVQNKENVADVRFYFAYESLRDDPRYAGLLKRMGLPE